MTGDVQGVRHWESSTTPSIKVPHDASTSLRTNLDARGGESTRIGNIRQQVPHETVNSRGQQISRPEGGKSTRGQAISVSKSLTEINLAGNNLGPEGAKALGPAISVSKSLTSIDLQTISWMRRAQKRSGRQYPSASPSRASISGTTVSVRKAQKRSGQPYPSASR